MQNAVNTSISEWSHSRMLAEKSSTGVLDPPPFKQEPLIKTDRRLFSLAFWCQSLVSKSSISSCNSGHGFASGFQSTTCVVSLSTILASCISLVRVRLGELLKTGSQSEPKTLSRKLFRGGGFCRLRRTKRKLVRVSTQVWPRTLIRTAMDFV